MTLTVIGKNFQQLLFRSYFLRSTNPRSNIRCQIYFWIDVLGFGIGFDCLVMGSGILMFAVAGTGRSIVEVVESELNNFLRSAHSCFLDSSNLIRYLRKPISANYQLVRNVAFFRGGKYFVFFLGGKYLCFFLVGNILRFF